MRANDRGVGPGPMLWHDNASRQSARRNLELRSGSRGRSGGKRWLASRRLGGAKTQQRHLAIAPGASHGLPPLPKVSPDPRGPESPGGSHDHGTRVPNRRAKRPVINVPVVPVGDPFADLDFGSVDTSEIGDGASCPAASPDGANSPNASLPALARTFSLATLRQRRRERAREHRPRVLAPRRRSSFANKVLFTAGGGLLLLDAPASAHPRVLAAAHDHADEVGLVALAHAPELRRHHQHHRGRRVSAATVAAGGRSHLSAHAASFTRDITAPFGRSTHRYPEPTNHPPLPGATSMAMSRSTPALRSEPSHHQAGATIGRRLSGGGLHNSSSLSIATASSRRELHGNQGGGVATSDGGNGAIARVPSAAEMVAALREHTVNRISPAPTIDASTSSSMKKVAAVMKEEYRRQYVCLVPCRPFAFYLAGPLTVGAVLSAGISSHTVHITLTACMHMRSTARTPACPRLWPHNSLRCSVTHVLWLQQPQATTCGTHG